MGRGRPLALVSALAMAFGCPATGTTIYCLTDSFLALTARANPIAQYICTPPPTSALRTRPRCRPPPRSLRFRAPCRATAPHHLSYLPHSLLSRGASPLSADTTPEISNPTDVHCISRSRQFLAHTVTPVAETETAGRSVHVKPFKCGGCSRAQSPDPHRTRPDQTRFTVDS